MLVAVAILTTAVLGIPLVIAADARARGGILAGMSFLYGSALVYASLFVLSLIGVPWSAANATALALVVAAGCWVFVRVRSRRGRSPAPGSHESTALPIDQPTTDEQKSRSGLRAHPIDILTAWIVGGFTLFATLAPVWFWDFWAIWGLKARVFVEARGIDWRFLESRWNDFAHPDYPLLVPLNYAWAALLSGGWSDRWLGFYTVAFGVALLLIVRHLAAEEIRPFAAATITVAATAFALTSSIGLAEGAIVAFGGAGLLMVRRSLLTGEALSMRHAAILLGCAACSKNEGISLVVAVAIALAFVAPRRILALWPSLAIVAPWTIVRTIRGLTTDVVAGSWSSRAAARLPQLSSIAGQLARTFADRLIWALLAAAIVALAFGRRPALRRERFVLLAVAIQVLFFCAVYLGSPWKDLALHIATSWPRLIRQVALPVLYVVSIALARTFAAEDDLAHDEARSER